MVDIADSLTNIDILSYSSVIAFWAMLVVWTFIIIFGIIMLVRYVKYNIPVEIYEKRGDAIIINGIKKAKLKVIDGVEEFELLMDKRGLFPFVGYRFIKWFRIDDPKFIIATRTGVTFKLVRIGETFQPIRIANPDVKLEIVPQNLLWWLSNKIVQVKEKYSDKKWWEPYIMPFSIIVVAIICFMMIIFTLDKVSGIQQFCSAAEQSLSDKLVQNLR